MSAIYQDGVLAKPIVTTGAMVVNACQSSQLVQHRQTTYTKPDDIKDMIKQPTVGALLTRDADIETGDLLFTNCHEPYTYRGGARPNVAVFASLVGLPKTIADKSVFHGVSLAPFRPTDKSTHLQRPTFATAVHGMYTLRNGPESVEVGDTLYAYIPTRTEYDAQVKRDTGLRCVAWLKPVKGTRLTQNKVDAGKAMSVLQQVARGIPIDDVHGCNESTRDDFKKHLTELLDASKKPNPEKAFSVILAKYMGAMVAIVSGDSPSGVDRTKIVGRAMSHGLPWGKVDVYVSASIRD